MREIVGKRSYDEYETKGFMTDNEFDFWLNLAKARKGTGNNRSILITGSKTETPLGFMNRYNPFKRNILPNFRKRKPWADFLEKYEGDVDAWEGSRFSRKELKAIERFFNKRPDYYSYEMGYKTMKSWPEKDSGGLVFTPSGKVYRIRAPWQ